MSKKWFMKWCPQDWRTDAGVRSLSYAARGLWMDMLCLMHGAEPYGHLTLNGRPMTSKQLAGLTNGREREVERLLKELENSGVFSRNPDDIIVNRRMIREKKVADLGANDVVKKWGQGDLSGMSRSERMAVARRLGKHTEAEWVYLLAQTEGACIRCEKPYENNGGPVKDHVIPIYQGGSDGIENIQPLCGRCNAAKGPETTDYRVIRGLKMPPPELKQMPRGPRHHVDEKTPTLELELELEVRKKEKVPSLRSGTKETAKRACRLPEGWEPRQQDLDGDHGKAAIAAGIDLARETERFRDYWRAASGSGASKSDWNAAFRFWLSNAPGLLRNRSAPPQAQAVSNIGWNRF